MKKRLTAFLSLLILLNFIFLPVFSQNAFAQSSNLAVTPPNYDDMGAVLKKMGISVKEVTSDDLNNLSTWKKYDAVYLNCGSIYPSDEGTAALKKYVQDGGVVYASDFSGQLIEAAFPDKINFFGEDKENPDSFNAKVGDSGEAEATIVDSGLASIVGKKKVNINFDLGGWVVIDSVNSGVRVHVTGDAKIEGSGSETKVLKDKPFVVSFQEGKGEVLFTSFHNEAQTTEDLDKILIWFAAKAKAGKLAKESRSLGTKGGNFVLQEVVDFISPDDSKSYKFNATGDGDFKVIINFEGNGKVNVTVKDPEGKEVLSDAVSSPPGIFDIKDAVKGEYTISLKGDSGISKNTSIVTVVSGPKNATSDPVIYGDEPQDELRKNIGIGASILIIIAVAVYFYNRFREPGFLKKRVKVRKD